MSRPPFLVTARNGRSHFFVGPFLPRAMAIAAQEAYAKVIIRLAGGMNNGDAIFPFFDNALVNVSGSILMSGGTRCFDEKGAIQASVVEVAAKIGSRYNNISMGSFPRTARFGFVDDGRFMVGDGENVTVNMGTDFVCAIQPGPEDNQVLGWDGDLEAYLSFMDGLRRENGFLAGVIVWNGGRVTIQEAIKARDRGFHVYVVSGSGRAAESEVAPANFSGSNIFHVPMNNPRTLADLLSEHHFTL